MALTLAELLAIDTATLRQCQADALKRHIIEKLEKIIRLVKFNRFDEIKAETLFSPAGDGYGCDNNYINFGIRELGEEWENLDIVEICERLQKLQGDI